MSATVDVTHFTDPGCPWAYSASPALAVLRWRYGAGLRWRLVTIGLTESAEQYVRRGYTPAGQAQGYARFRRYGMPFQTQPRERVAATARACRAIVAARQMAPEREVEVFRALQFAQFCSTAVFDTEDGLRRALARVEGIDVESVIGVLDAPEVSDAYDRDRADARSALGSATEFQGKAANTDGVVRYTAPSLTFRSNGTHLEAGGFQPVEAYDVVLANLTTDLERRPEPEDLVEALAEFPYPLTTAEVAAIAAPHLVAPDRAATEQRLIEAAGEGRVRREPLGDDALWHVA
jgi:protein-disulfide isomerase-like protein with CxxC motif